MSSPSRARMRELIEQSNLIEGIDDPAEIEQSLVAWDYLIKYKANLSHTTIRKVQKIITLHQTDLRPDQRGYYRDMSKVNVRVGWHIPPAWALVPAAMDAWLLEYKELDPWPAHKRFETIHPFVDGNGRTGRMLMWWQEVKSGLEPTMISAADRFVYYRRLEENRT